MLGSRDALQAWTSPRVTAVGAQWVQGWHSYGSHLWSVVGHSHPGVSQQASEQRCGAATGPFPDGTWAGSRPLQDLGLSLSLCGTAFRT